MNETGLVLKKFSSLSGETKHTNYNSMVLRAVDPSSTKKDVITWLGDGEGMSASDKEDDAQTES